MSALLSRQQAQLAASCLSLLVYTGCADNATAPEPAPAPLTELPAASKQAWEAFRAAFPFHTQGLALSEEHTDGTRTLIVAEPPPSVTVAKVQAVDSTAILAAEVMNHRLGFDGYVRDLVLTVADDEAKLAGMESGINRLVHGSSYKAQVLLAPYHPARLAVKLDLSVTALEVEQWLHAPDLTLLSVFGEPIEGVEALRALPGSRVAYSATPGLVLWWIPSGTLLDEQLEVIRQFTIDSDLILGAEIADDGVLVVGRERLAPLSLLPPLRAETIALLAGVDLAELAQSYERNHPLAGPLNADLDWAPIYLNPELLDTEYGSLLNLTDQILKGWSNNGLTHYENFSYPEPKEWPFEDPIPIHLKADTLTYNWNTTGTGYTVSGQSGVVYALNRTGALPVSYIPGGDEAALQNPDSSEIARLRAAEERAYEYFAHLNDPLLVRVVQYASLFQIFTLAPSIGARVTQAPEPPEPVLESFTLDVLRKIRDVEGSERERLIEAIKSRGERFGLDPTYATFAFSLLEGTLVGASDEDLTKLVQAVRLKHIFKAEAETDEDAASLLELLEAARVVLPLAAAQQQIYTKYSAAVAGQRRSGWIRTPSLVLSGGSGSLAMSIGGHNLSARVSKFKTDPSIARNSLRIGEIDGNPVVFVNPADAAKISEMVRTAGKNQADPAQLMAQLHMELQTVKEPRPRPMGVALGHPPPGGGRRPPPGASPPSGSDGAAIGFGWGWAPRDHDLSQSLRDEARVAQSHHTAALTVERRTDGTFSVLAAPDAEPLQVLTGTDLTEVVVAYARNHVGSARDIQIHLTGLSSEEAHGLLQGARVRFGAEPGGPAIQGRVRSGKLTLARLQAELPARYDFARARVVEAIDLPDGKGLDLTIDVPRRADVSPGPNGRIRAIVQFLTRLAPAAVGRIKAAVLHAIDALLQRPGASEPLQLLDDLERELRTIERDTGVAFDKLEVKFEEELGDITLVELERGDRVAGDLSG